MSLDKINLSPLMRQYYEIKEKHPDTLLLFQVGDFYELFFEDAQKASSFLGITLTQRGTTPQGHPIPLCGVPVHVLDHYLTKLVKGGFKVAVCDQLEPAKAGKVVERGVTQVLTPGTLTDIKLLDEKSASYLCAFFPTEHKWTLLFAELLTGQLFVTSLRETSLSLLEAELSRFMPDEVILPDTKAGQSFALHLQRHGFALSLEKFNPHGDNSLDHAFSWFNQQFPQSPLVVDSSDATGFGITVLYTYLKRNNERGLMHLKQLFAYQQEDFLMLDAATQRNLELVKNSQDGSASHTLFAVLDKAVTSMGSRTIKKWILRPLIKQELIEQRLDAVETFVKDIGLRDQIRKVIQEIGDIERVVGRIALRRATLHDYLSLLRALMVVPGVAKLLDEQPHTSLLGIVRSKITDFKELRDFLITAINDDTTKEWLVKSGYNGELDRLRKLLEEGTQAIIMLERKEQEATGINSLKVKFNGAHGYGIEITKANLHAVPAHYMRTQTLVNRERFTTQELRDLEYDLMRARTEITEIEKEIFESIKQKVESFVGLLKRVSQALSYIDALAALAYVSYSQGYSRPTFNDHNELMIVEGRHPVVELRLQSKFVPNSVSLSQKESLWLITGPNMGGKSTFLRQVALITLMAHVGIFVPAKKADISLVDRIFTRIGAADNVAEGKSTFLVEMEETALICNHATHQSLVILDEVGRGTSTFDGLAIAQAVVEYIYTHIKARCLFATHYHELTALSEKFPGIASYYAASTRTPSGIVLLHKILPGIADGSFGLEVAKVAQLPSLLLQRAHEILGTLTQEGHSFYHGASEPLDIQVLAAKCSKLEQRKQELEAYISQREQESGPERMLAAEIAQLDCEHLTAKQALDVLWRLKEYMRAKT